MRRVEGRALDTDPSIELMKMVAADFGGRIVLISLFLVAAAAAVVILVFDRRQLRRARRHSAETRHSFLLIKEKQMFVMVAAV